MRAEPIGAETSEERCESTIVIHQNWDLRCQRSTDAHAVHHAETFAEKDGKAIRVGVQWP